MRKFGFEIARKTRAFTNITKITFIRHDCPFRRQIIVVAYARYQPYWFNEATQAIQEVITEILTEQKNDNNISARRETYVVRSDGVDRSIRR